MIYVRLRDGMGNQMFTYAYARALQEKVPNEKILLDVGDFKDGYRSYSLNHFVLNKKVKIAGKIRQIITKVFIKLKYGNYNLRPQNEEFSALAKKNLYCDFFSYAYHQPEIYKKGCKVVRGFFQSHKNFQKISNIIVEEFTVKTPPSPENEKMLEQISQSNAVCVHMRRGDYISDPQWKEELAICTEEYYKKAMDLVASKVENPIFYIFSNSHNDIEWIKENYKFDYNLKYVDLDNPDYEELRLMYSCKHFIISNSTFSWWAQYLSKNEDKIVVAPSVWNRKIEASNIYMDGWEIVKVD